MNDPGAYAGRRIALLTQHGKERVTAPLLDAALGCRVERVSGYDTDRLGTFTRDIPRLGSQLDAARRKARIGMQLSGLPLGLASEGAFGSDPFAGLFPWNVKIVIFIDDERGLEIAGVAQGNSGLSHTLVADWDAAEAFARQAGFPAHHLVVRPQHQDDPCIEKNLRAWPDLQMAFERAREQAANGQVFLESDVRVRANPTRMANIGLAAENLMAKLRSACPGCGARDPPALRRLWRAHARDPRRHSRLREMRTPRTALARRDRSRPLRLLQSLTPMATASAPPWHTQTSQAACATLDVDPARGLASGEAGRRMAQHGENRLVEARPRPAWLKFLDQFRNFLVVVLLFAAVLAWAVGDLKDAVVILLVVVFNAALGFYQEHRAEQTLAALKNMLAARARALRDGQVVELDAARLVPGDIVLLEAGDRIPADGRLLAAHALEVEEAALTGESHAVGKSIAALEIVDLPLGDRLNMLYMNTVVTRGRAELLVTATGMATEMGRLAGMIAAAPESATPLQTQLDTLGRKLAAIAGVVVTLIFILDFARGLPWTQAAMTAVALAVAAIPEGLPAVGR
jgi:hypothetical protein